MNSRKLYIALAVVFVTSLAVGVLGPFSNVVRELSAIPAVVSLFVALLQIMRDRIAYERSRLVLESQNSFAIGATSHMANVAFDKHVSFCEEYVAEMFKALSTLFREGPTRGALHHALILDGIREKWAVWLTPSLEVELERFEAAIRRIGAHAGLVEDAPGEPNRAVSIQTMYGLFAEVIGLKEWEGAPPSQDLAVKTVIGKLRKVLGTEELTALRNNFVSRALEQHEGIS
jgi:hypothetical protein